MSLLKYDGALAVETTAPISNFYGTDVTDNLTGAATAEGFWGGQGDLMTGASGDDTYYLKSAQDRVVEQAGDGVDKIVSWSNVYLPNYANIENLEVNGDKTYGAGNAGDNVIQGGAGSQQLYGGGGQDVLLGGAGADTFIVLKGQGNDTVQDFTPGQDILRLSAGYTTFGQVQSHLSQAGADVKLDMGGGDALLLRNLTVSQLSAGDFQLQLDTGKLGAMTFHDEFTGPLSLWDAQSNPTGTWRPDFGYQGEQGLGSYTLSSNNEQEIYVSPYFRGHAGDFSVNPFVSNADGTLSIVAQASSNPEIFGYQYTSGMISTQATFAQTYGYFEMRAELPHVAGGWPAFWLLPADGSWPPELDVMETLTSDPHADWTTEHSGLNGAHASSGQAAFVPDTADGYHTYSVLWTATDLNWYVDGVEIFHAATPADMNKPMYMIANLALGGWGGAIDAAGLPAEMKIDYIRAYALGDAGATDGLPPAPMGASTPSTQTTPVTSGGTTPVAGVHLTASVAGDKLAGGAGTDTLSASQGADVLSGGAGADLFQFKNLPWSAGHITDFQVGVDKIDLSSLFLGGYTGVDPVAEGYLSFVSDGAGGAKVMLDIDGHGATNPWLFTIVTLDNVSPAGLTAATTTTTGAGAPATNPVTTATPTAGEGLVLTSATPGDRLTGGAGADTLIASQGADVLSGGDGADTFAFKALPWSAGHIVDFHVGVDRLDLSAFVQQSNYTGSDPVADGYLILSSNGAGGTQVFWDSDGPAAGNPWPITVTTLDNVKPSDLTAAKLLNPQPAVPIAAAAAAVVAPTTGVTLTSSGYSATLTGGAGADTINAGQGPDALTGGAGVDHFVFGATPWNSGHISDFTPGTDVLDLRAIFAAAHYNGADPIADHFLSFQSDAAGGTKIYIDVDGPRGSEWPFLITTLDHVSPTAISAQDWLFH